MAKKRTKKVKRLVEEKNPELSVQIGDPVMLRKDVLEALREVIIFMQGYEKFRKIQEEKIATFAVLKKNIRDVNLLVDQHLKRYLPKGSLKEIKPNLIKEEKIVLKEELPPIE